VAQENVLMMKGQPAKAYLEQDQLAHIQGHLDFYQNPVFGGGNPLIMPQLLQPMVEHLQEHFGMWYQIRMNEYIHEALGRNKLDYEDPRLTPRADQLYALASQHVQMDSQQTFAKVMPIFQQMMQQIQQMKQGAQPPMDPDAQVLLQTSMAETQRRAARDKADTQLAQQKLQADMQLDQARIAAENQRDQATQQLDIAMNAEDNLTRERIESAKLSSDADKLRHEQVKTALDLENQAQSYLGGRNV